MNSKPRKASFTVTGIAMTVLGTAFFAWSAQQWFGWDAQPGQAGGVEANEIRAFSNLQLIADAQRKYRQRDWDGDGKKTFAAYYIHLWTTLTAGGEPKRIGLIPRDLGFAMEAENALGGYYFLDLHDRVTSGSSERTPLNSEKEWAVIGLPTNHGLTGRLAFLADASGAVFVNTATYVAPQYPIAPQASGWIKLSGKQQLRDVQEHLTGFRDAKPRPQ